MCANDGGSVIFGSAAATKIAPRASCTRRVSQEDARKVPSAECRVPSGVIFRSLSSLFLGTHHSALGTSWCCPRMDGPAALLPIRKPILIDIHIVEERAVKLAGEHVRV